MRSYLTSGQVARKLRVSVSTLKRWLEEPKVSIPEMRNYNGWRLFTEADLESLKQFRRDLKRNGKRFNETTLIPVVIAGGAEGSTPSGRTQKTVA